MDFQRSRSVLVWVALSAAATLYAQVPGFEKGPHGKKGGPGMKRDLSSTLRKMVESSGRLRYTGQRTVEFRLNGERSRNIEFVTVDGRNLRVEFADGSASAGQVIVENDKGRFQYFPGRNEIEQGPRQRDEVIARLKGMIGGAGRVNFSETAGGQVAGRTTTNVVFTDKRGNVVQRLWIDIETGLPLRREILDPSGSRVGFFEFTRINFRPSIRPEDFEIRRKGAKLVRPVDRVKQAAAELKLTAYVLGSGAELVNARKLGAKAGVLVQTYRLGGTRVSLFQTEGDVNPERLKRSGDGRVNSYRWQAHGYTFVLMGDLPQDQLRRLSESLVLAK